MYMYVYTAKHLCTYYVPSMWSVGGRVGSGLLAVSTDFCWPAIEVFCTNMIEKRRMSTNTNHLIRVQNTYINKDMCILV